MNIAARVCQFALFTLLAATCPSLAWASETLNAEIPEGWIVGNRSQGANLHLMEYFPADSPPQWRDKLSVEAMSGVGLPDPLAFIDGWAADQAQLCELFQDFPIFAGFENGYATVVRLLQCGRNKQTGKPIVTLVKIIRGNKSLYTITRLWRLQEALVPTEDSDGDNQADDNHLKVPLDPSEVALWSNLFKTFTVCDPNLPAHACPNQTPNVPQE